MRIPVLIGATKATAKSGRIPLPAGKFRLEIEGVISSRFVHNSQLVTHGTLVEGDQIIELHREVNGMEEAITIYAVRVT